jgi:hypothetical protein
MTPEQERTQALRESLVISSMMMTHQALKVAIEMLSPEDFYYSGNIMLFNLISERYALSSTDGSMFFVDLRNCIDRHPCSSMLRKFLDDALQAPALECEIVKYCNELLNAKRGRAAVTASEEIAALAEDADPDAIADAMSAKAEELRASAQNETDPVSEMYEELDLAVEGRRFAAPLPWKMLNLDTRALLPKTVTVLCGSPGSTKSLAALQLLRHLRGASISCAALELEDGVSYHLRRAAAQITGVSDLTDDGWCRGNPDKVAQIKNQLGPTLEELRRCIEAPKSANKCTPKDLLGWVASHARQNRVLIIDPITMMVKGRNPWADDEEFLFGAKRIIERTGSSLLLVSHPRKMPFGATQAHMSMDDMAGGSAYQRFCQTVIFLLAHDTKTTTVEHEHGASDETYNRTMVVFKARNGRGAEGHKFAYRFSPKTLELYEVGRIRRKPEA